jgi:hypothetical protein
VRSQVVPAAPPKQHRGGRDQLRDLLIVGEQERSRQADDGGGERRRDREVARTEREIVGQVQIAADERRRGTAERGEARDVGVVEREQQATGRIPADQRRGDQRRPNCESA